MLFPIIILLALLFILNLILLVSINNLFVPENITSIDVNISIIVAAKNEAENIPKFIGHLKKLDYPAENFEVILVDDNSTDDTYNLIKEQIIPLPNFKVLSAKSAGPGGKRDALSLGIQNAKYPFIMITDADCCPDSNWLKSFSQKFDQGYEMSFGVAPFYQSKNLVNRISCFENLKSSIFSFAMTSIRLPYTATARNFGFTKKVFDSIGGYANTKDTRSGDDDLLLREAIKKKIKIGVVTENNSFVYSKTKNNFRDYLQQKARHTQTSFYYLNIHKTILGFWHLLNLFFLFSPVLMISNLQFGILLPSKLLIDLLVTKATQKRFSYNYSIVKIIYLQIFYELLLIIHFFNARFTEIKWK